MPKDTPMTARQVGALLVPESINLNVQAQDKNAALHEIAARLSGNAAVPDFEAFFSEILARETIGTTAMGHGVAVPHARTDRCRDIVIVAGRSGSGVDYATPDGLPVQLIFLIGTPRQQVTEYLRIVGTLARVLAKSRVRKQLLDATDAASFIQAISTADE